MPKHLWLDDDTLDLQTATRTTHHKFNYGIQLKADTTRLPLEKQKIYITKNKIGARLSVSIPTFGAQYEITKSIRNDSIDKHLLIKLNSIWQCVCVCVWGRCARIVRRGIRVKRSQRIGVHWIWLALSFRLYRRINVLMWNGIEFYLMNDGGDDGSSGWRNTKGPVTIEKRNSVWKCSYARIGEERKRPMIFLSI